MSTHAAEPGRPSDTFELRLRIARFHAGDLSAKEAAMKVGVSGQTWRNWESGVHADAARRPSMLSYIAKQLHVDETWLRDGGPLRDDPGPRPGKDSLSPTTRGSSAEMTDLDSRNDNPLPRLAAVA